MKTLSQTVAALILVVLASSLAFAQGTVNFSGTWVLDNSKSEMPNRPGRSGEATETHDVSRKMVIEQQSATLKITRALSAATRERSTTVTYNTTGQETTESTPRGGSIVSRASWEGNKLVITSTRTMTRPRRGETGERKIEEKDVWSLSPDGRTLTIEETRQTSRGERTAKTVFNKQ